MRKLHILVSRNILLFLRNKTNVLLSFFAVAIVIGLYVLFLRDFVMQSVEHTGVESYYVKEFTDRMMVSGLLTVINITTCFGIMQLSVADAASGILRDFLVAPVNRFQIEVGYWMSSVLVSFFFSAFTFGGMEIFFSFYYEDRMSLEMFGKGLVILLYSSCMNSGILIIFMRFVKDTTSFSTFGNLYGMMCGFLAGTYLPLSMYPQKLRKVLFYFPPMQLTSILRQNCLSVFEKGDKLIGETIYPAYGVRLVKGDIVVPMREQWSLLLVEMAVVLIIVRMVYKDGYEKTT